MHEPVIPLKHSELLYVALAVVIQELDRRTQYPTENLWLAISAYEKGRDEYLHGRGWTDEARRDVTAAATEALTQWIDERTMRSAEPDFHEWAKELGEHDE